MKHFYEKKIYLDYQASTPCDKKVLEEIMPYFKKEFGNAHSSSHVYGWNANDAVEIARGRVASTIECSADEVVFTSGATESNNLAIKGLVENFPENSHIITVVTEHKCVLESCKFLEKKGYEVTYLPVNSDGLIDLEELNRAKRNNTKLISVMAVNNEIGIIQPLKKIGLFCKKNKIIFHVDAAQGVGKIPISVNNMFIDLLSLSGHKMYGPKGIGALYIRKGVNVKEQMSGGGQERGYRSGTLPVGLCVGLGAACNIAVNEMKEEGERITYLRDYFLSVLMDKLKGVYLNGSLKNRVPGNLNISFDEIEGEGLMLGLKGIAVSSGSACASSILKPSYVLKALKIREDLIHSSLRIGFGRFTTKEEVDIALYRIVKEVKRLRKISPMKEIYKNKKY